MSLEILESGLDGNPTLEVLAETGARSNTNESGINQTSNTADMAPPADVAPPEDDDVPVSDGNIGGQEPELLTVNSFNASIKRRGVARRILQTLLRR